MSGVSSARGVAGGRGVSRSRVGDVGVERREWAVWNVARMVGVEVDEDEDEEEEEEGALEVIVVVVVVAVAVAVVEVEVAWVWWSVVAGLGREE